MKNLPPADPSFGLSCAYVQPALMAQAHRHNDLELNLVERGSLTYRFGGGRQTVVAGELLIFWAAMPHQAVASEPETSMWWVTLPLALFLRWRLPGGLAEPLLRGTPLREPDPSWAAADQAALRRWHADLQRAEGEDRAVVMLELEARLRRLARRLPGEATGQEGGAGATSKAEAMAQLIAERYAEPLRVEQIAAAVALHPHYAMQIFRRSFGVSIGTYLTQQRIAHAQRLLATSEQSILAIAYEAGFASASRFYAAFQAHCGLTPRAYRQQLGLG
jgi:AraC family transcriptional regulator, melibiose operon regulatory protein